MGPMDDDDVSNSSGNETFEEVVAARLSRRGFVSGGLATAAVASMSGISSLLTAVPASAKGRGAQPLLGFAGIPVSSEDAVVVPPGYTAAVLIAWGDPVSSGPPFKPDASNTAAEQARQWGMHNDGIVYFPIDGSSRGLLVQNNEYTDDVLLFPDGIANWDQEKTNKSLHAHGVSIIEIARQGDAAGSGDEIATTGTVMARRPSVSVRAAHNRPDPDRIGGPARGDARLVTSADPTGHRVLGTINNCAMGFTPWGTYLTCEENFNGYFRKTGTQTQLEQRYGINATGAGYLWHTTDTRFNVNEEPNEPNRFGWVVEFDPFNPSSIPVKRTALGRLKHEGAWVQEARDGRVVVYMGDDEQFEYIYRFVSNLTWRRAR